MKKDECDVKNQVFTSSEQYLLALVDMHSQRRAASENLALFSVGSLPFYVVAT